MKHEKIGGGAPLYSPDSISPLSPQFKGFPGGPPTQGNYQARFENLFPYRLFAPYRLLDPFENPLKIL